MRHLFRNIAILVAIFAFYGCKESYKDIKVTSFEIVSVTPEGRSDGSALVRVGLSNPITGFEITNASATLMVGDAPSIRISADQLMVSAKSDKVYQIPVNIRIVEGANPFELLKVLKPDDIPALSLNISGRVALRGGMGVNIDRNIPLDGIMDYGSFVSNLAGSSLRDMTVTGLEICLVEPEGTDKVEIVAKLGLSNPYVPFELSDASCVLKLDGVHGIEFASDDLIVIRKGEKNYYLSLKGKFGDDFNPCSILNLLKDVDLPVLTADISVRLAARGGIGATITRKDIQIGSMK